MGSFVRRVKTASGATAVQIVHKRGRDVQGIEHIGSAHDADQLALLEQVVPQFRPPLPIEGMVGFNGALNGTLRPFTIKANGKARASALVVNGVRIDTLSFDIAEAPRGLRLTHIDARLAEARLPSAAA